MGATRVNLGTAALEDPQWTARVIHKYGDKIAVGLDVRGEKLATRGWVEESGNIWEVLSQLEEAGCARYVVTDITKDGTLTGPNTDLLLEIATQTGKPVIASGGISTLDDIAQLAAMANHGIEGAIIGKALYAGQFTLPQALQVASGTAAEDVYVLMSDKPQLPGHIQAAIDRNLARQNRDAFGHPTDSAGQTWRGRDLGGTGINGSSNPLHAFDTDDGLEDEAWSKVSQDLIDGNANEKDVFAVLAKIRVFAAVVPTVAETTQQVHVDDDGKEYTVESDKEADVALVSLESADGRGALPVFTSIPKLTAWHK